MENTALNRMANDWTMHWVDGADHELKVNAKLTTKSSPICVSGLYNGASLYSWQNDHDKQLWSLCCFSSGTGLGRRKKT